MLTVRAYSEATGPCRVVEASEVARHLEEGGALVWIDAQDPTAEEIDGLRSQLGIHELAAEDLHHARQRVKLDSYEDHFLLVAYELEMVGEDLAAREVDVLVGDRWIITARQGESHPHVPFTDEVERRFEWVRHSFRGVDEGHLLHAVLDTLADRYLDVVEEMRGHLDTIERNVFANDGRDDERGSDRAAREAAIQRDVYELRRALVRFIRFAAPLGDAVAGLVRREVGHLDRTATAYLQDVQDHVVRAVEDTQSQLALLDGALQAYLGLASQRLNVAMERMTSWGAILLVATLIAGIYGMNFEHMPELHWTLGYPLAMGAMVASGAALYRMFKKRDWL